jgi:hypothetical protein
MEELQRPELGHNTKERWRVNISALGVQILQ